MESRKTIVIAEIGENHVGDMQRARQMVLEAAMAGADIVKFQSYLGKDVHEADPEKEWFGKAQLADDMHFELKAVAEQAGVEFLSAAFSVERARFLVEKVGLRKIKVASSELLNFGLLDYLNGRIEVLFLSTGLADMNEIGAALGHVQKIPHVYVMQCTTQYPCAPCDANLSVIARLKTSFPQHRAGYSDHTIGILAPLVAVSLGAEVIEKHFTLDKTLPGTDHVLSVTPAELKLMVERIRLIEQLLGNPDKRPCRGELELRDVFRKRFPKNQTA